MKANTVSVFNAIFKSFSVEFGLQQSLHVAMCFTIPKALLLLSKTEKKEESDVLIIVAL